MTASYLIHIGQMRDFGIYCAPISTLAKLLALEQFSQGEIEIVGFSNQVDYDTNSPDFLKSIAIHIQNYERTLTDSVERKDIKTVWVTRDPATGKIDPENTLIHHKEFSEYLQIHDINHFGCFEAEMADFLAREWDLYKDITNRVMSRRLSTLKPNEETIEDEVEKILNEPDRLREILAENLSVKHRALTDRPHTNLTEKSLGARERTTLLTIIAALAKEANIDISKPGKAGEIISDSILELGIEVDHYTIEKKLKEIPDALERRGKLTENQNVTPGRRRGTR